MWPHDVSGLSVDSAGNVWSPTAAAGIADGRALAIEACGSQNCLSGPARLLLYDSQVRLLRRVALGRCTGGNELSSDPPGTNTLVSLYLYAGTRAERDRAPSRRPAGNGQMAAMSLPAPVHRMPSLAGLRC